MIKYIGFIDVIKPFANSLYGSKEIPQGFESHKHLKFNIAEYLALKLI